MRPQQQEIAVAFGATVRSGVRRIALTCLTVLLLAPAAASSAGTQTRAPSSATTRAQLNSVRAQINREKQQADREAHERARLTAQLRAVELSLENSSAELE